MSHGAWFYLPHGVMTHWLDRGASCYIPESACGIEPDDPADWYGTGNQAEYERAAALPKCRRCASGHEASNHG